MIKTRDKKGFFKFPAVFSKCDYLLKVSTVERLVPIPVPPRDEADVLRVYRLRDLAHYCVAAGAAGSSLGQTEVRGSALIKTTTLLLLPIRLYKISMLIIRHNYLLILRISWKG